MTRLLPPEALIRTGPVDHADWNYRPVLGWIQRRRFALIEALLPAERIGKLLEIGYGSGVFMPELAARCEQLYGIDVHPRAEEVQTRLLEHGVKAQLASGSAENLPYDNAAFDAVVAISSLEFVERIAAATREIQRVLKPEGHLVIVTPGQSSLVDWGLRLITGRSAGNDFADRRERLMPALLKHFSIESQRTFPRGASVALRLYTALRMRPRARSTQQEHDGRMSDDGVNSPAAADVAEA